MTSKKILIIDDQIGIRVLLGSALAKYEIQDIATGQEALEIMPTWNPDLVITDFNLPGMNGIQTIAQINQLGFHPATILMTAYDRLSLDIDLEISGFIEKPFDIQNLIAMVDDILNQEVVKI